MTNLLRREIATSRANLSPFRSTSRQGQDLYSRRGTTNKPDPFQACNFCIENVTIERPRIISTGALVSGNRDVALFRNICLDFANPTKNHSAGDTVELRL